MDNGRREAEGRVGGASALWEAPSLPAIPLFDGDASPLGLVERAPERIDDLMRTCAAHYGRLPLRVGDAVSRRWLARADTPYRDEILAIADRLRTPGAVTLNLSYEWTCSAAAGPDPDGVGPRLIRTLDWRTRGLGRNVVVARRESAAGPYFAATWPGFVGVLSAMAPGRFAAVINQPPLRRRSPFFLADWARDRLSVWRSTALTATHLLRLVFDRCGSFAEAVETIRTTPICLPAFFTISGIAPDESCVIERLENQAKVHRGAVCVTNHWLDLRADAGDRDRTGDSRDRLAAIAAARDAAPNDLSWVKAPVLNRITRLAMVANAATSTLLLQGWEPEGPATAVFDLRARG